MGYLTHIIDPRFLLPLASALGSSPCTELELRAKFNRDTPNRNLSQRSLRTLLEFAQRGNLITFELGVWRTVPGQAASESVSACLARWCEPAVADDEVFRYRAAAALDRGLLTAGVTFTPTSELAQRNALTSPEWARLVSGICDIRLLTGRSSKHAEADFLTLYRAGQSAPVTDDADVSPRIPRDALPSLPASPDEIFTAIRQARSFWDQQALSFLGLNSKSDLECFIIYAKDFLDLLFWGDLFPLRSSVSPEDLRKVSLRLQRFGLRAEDLSTVWRSLPSTYRIIARLSWGIRYLSNNLSHPEPAQPDGESFLRICHLPAEKQSAISARRSGHTLLSLARPLRVLHRAIQGWRSRTEVIAAAQALQAAISADMLEDKLARREFAERVKRLRVVAPLHILDALAHPVPLPVFPERQDEVLTSAGCISTLCDFFESVPGYAYAETRLALHAELDFQRRFNLHSLTPPQRYDGVWRDSIAALVTRVEDTRRACIPHRAGTST